MRCRRSSTPLSKLAGGRSFAEVFFGISASESASQWQVERTLVSDFRDVLMLGVGYFRLLEV